MIIFRYLLKELCMPFIFSLVAFGSIMTTGFVLFNLIEESVQYQIPFSLFLKIMLLRMPEMLFYTLPMAMLLACLLAVSRLSADRELLIIRMSGKSFYHVASPFILFAVIISSLTILLNETIVPISGFVARQTLHYVRTKGKAIPLTKKHIIYKELAHGEIKKLIYAKSFDGLQMKEVVALLYQGDHIKFLRAKTAHQQGNEWIFESGEIIELKDSGRTIQGFLKFNRYALRLNVSLQHILNERRKPMEMNMLALGQYIDNLTITPESVAPLKVRWHQKLTIPFAAIVFTLLGLGLAGQTLPSASLSLGLSILIIFGYYVLMAIFTALGDTGQIQAWVGAWTPNIIGVGLGLILLYRQDLGAIN